MVDLLILAFFAAIRHSTLMSFIIGPNYQAPLVLVYIIMAYATIMSIGNGFVTFFLAIQDTRPLLYASCIGAIVNLGLNCYFVPIYGMIAAAGSTLCAYTLWTIYLVISATLRLRAVRREDFLT
jgi:O-antigen/teichoic acid export membrane protein